MPKFANSNGGSILQRACLIGALICGFSSSALAGSELQVRFLQELLAELGYEVGNHDGKLSPSTQSAITAYNKKRGREASDEYSDELVIDVAEFMIKNARSIKCGLTTRVIPLGPVTMGAWQSTEVAVDRFLTCKDEEQALASHRRIMSCDIKVDSVNNMFSGNYEFRCPSKP